MALIDVDDVQLGFKPTIPEEDEPYVTELIEEAEITLESRIGDLDRWVNADPKKLKRVRLVLKHMIRRLLISPDGLLSETDGDYTYTRARELVGTGAVRVIQDDLRLLGIARGRARSIRVGLPDWSPRNQPRYPL